MEVSVESLDGLKRRITVVIPSEQVEEKIKIELKKLASRVQIDGFRRGKVPFHVVEKRYAESIRMDAGQELLKETLDDAITQEQLLVVSTPKIDIFEIEKGKDFRYAATVEIYPEFEIKELDKKTTLEILQSSVSDTDLAQMIEKLREQNKNWEPVSRAAKMGDKVNIDFKGYVDDKPFERGEAQGFELELGSNQMIPGFEEKIKDHTPGESFSIEVTFPKDYQQDALADKAARFDIVLNEVLEGKLPEIDADFIKKFGVESGEKEAFLSDIRSHMERELERRLREINHDISFTGLAKNNPFEVPDCLLDKEIENLKHELYHQIFGAKHSDHEKIPDFPRELFEDRAKKRVHLGLLISEYVKKHRFVVDEERVEKILDRFASAYVDPEVFKTQSRQDKKWMADVEAAVLEQIISEHILNSVMVREKQLDYQEVMNYRNAEEKQTEETQHD